MERIKITSTKIVKIKQNVHGKYCILHTEMFNIDNSYIRSKLQNYTGPLYVKLRYLMVVDMALFDKHHYTH